MEYVLTSKEIETLRKAKKLAIEGGFEKGAAYYICEADNSYNRKYGALVIMCEMFHVFDSQLTT